MIDVLLQHLGPGLRLTCLAGTLAFLLDPFGFPKWRVAILLGIPHAINRDFVESSRRGYAKFMFGDGLECRTWTELQDDIFEIGMDGAITLLDVIDIKLGHKLLLATRKENGV